MPGAESVPAHTAFRANTERDPAAERHNRIMTTWRRVLGAVLLLAAAASFIPTVLVAEDVKAVPGLVLQSATAVAGILLLRVPELRRDGWWMLGATIGVGVTAFNTSTFESGWGSGYLLQFGWSFYYAEVACLVGPALRLPDQPAPPRTVRRLSLAFWIVLVLLPALSGLLWDPVAMKGYSGPGRWFTLVPFEPLAWGVPRAVPVMFLPFAVAFTVAQVRRFRHAAGPNRVTVRLLASLTVLLVWGLEAQLVLNAVAPADVFWSFTTVITALLAAALLVVLVFAVRVNLRRAGFLDALLATGGHAPQTKRCWPGTWRTPA